KAEKVAKQIGAEPINNLLLLDIDVDLLILAVPDDVLSDICAKLLGHKGLIVHVSGSTPLNVFDKRTDNFGVFYPLQTFSIVKEVSFTDIPICVEADNKHNLLLLKGLANKISRDVREIDSDQRLALHIAAVFSCNFVNYMNVMAEDLLQNKNIDFDILLPLIKETSKQLLKHSPKEMQTGPAKRNDIRVIEKHLTVLQSSTDKREIYKLLSDNIKNFFK
ncbi:MAG: DUF2520 domain-containing protein, partial [Bacteroidota bacterium]|nr:DUF2520 domain-containing protein [Bacteroidota bacterium]